MDLLVEVKENLNLKGLIVHFPFELLNSEDQVIKFRSQRRERSKQ